jgi:zeaxanthin glucosyltransferase
MQLFLPATYVQHFGLEAVVCAAGIEFCRIGFEDYPPRTLKRLDEKLAQLRGIAAFRFTSERVRNSTRMILRDGPRGANS